MMGAAESISDLRSLLSIVAEETGALKMNDADEDSVGWTTEGPLPMTFGHVRRAHAALAALEAALSAAEPVAWLAARKWEQMTAAEPWLTNVVYSEDQAEFFPCVPLYAAPPAPSVAVKALEWAIDENHSQLQRAYFYTIESEFRQGFALHTAGKMGVFWFPTEREAKAAAQADYEARIRSALSAQVKDVAGWQEVPPETVIEEATKGKQVLAYENGRYYNAWLEFEASEGGWLWYDEADSEPNPTHWMPLPAAPAKQEIGHVTSK